LSSSQKKLLSFTNFNRGINTTSSFDELESTELVTAVNIDLKARGGYTQRKGCSIYKTIEADEEILEFPVSRLIDYPGNPLLVINKTLRDFDSTPITLLLNSNDVDYEFFTNEKLYMLDGTEYWVYDGTTCQPVTPADGSDLAPIKRCTRLIQRGQRMFALGDTQNPNYLYFSEIGDPTNFKPSSIVKAVTDDSDVLKGLSLFSNSLLAFKEDEIFRWSGWDPAQTCNLTHWIPATVLWLLIQSVSPKTFLSLLIAMVYLLLLLSRLNLLSLITLPRTLKRSGKLLPIKTR